MEEKTYTYKGYSILYDPIFKEYGVRRFQFVYVTKTLHAAETAIDHWCSTVVEAVCQ